MLAYLEVAGLSHVYHQPHIPRYVRTAGRDTGGSVYSTLKRWAARGRAAVARARERRATIRLLSALDNRALADIGVYRGQIPAVAAAVADGHDIRRGTGSVAPGKAGTDGAPPHGAANDNAAEIAA